jgi:hypothetical protein
MRRMLIRLVAVGLAATFAFGGVAQAAHMSRVMRAHLKARVAQVMPSAQAQVAAAQAQGPAAVKALAQKAIDTPLVAPNTTSPEQYALLQALQPTAGQQTTSGVSSGLTASIASACWYVGNHIWNSTNYTEAGIVIAHAEKDHGYWCGNGSSITDAGGANLGYYHKTSASAPFCLVTVFNVNGWDAPNHAWAHGGLTTHQGTYSPWTSCVTYQGANDGIRIAANGHYDFYWDF